MVLSAVISRFSRKKVLVVGDLILDHYIWGRVKRISPEAPVPVVDVTRESFMLGGAANVAHNIVALGGKASVVGIRGDDHAGSVMIDQLLERGVDCDGVFISDRPTTVKTRVIAHSQHVVRFDREDSSYVEGRSLSSIAGYLRSVQADYDAVIISDYRKGVVTAPLIRDVVRRAKGTTKGPRRTGMFVAVDPKVGHFAFYRGVSLITPNVAEAASGSRIEISDDGSLLRAGRALLQRLGCGAVLITRGEQGMSLFEKNRTYHIPTVARKVYDVTGAGDTVVAAFTLARISGAGMRQAAIIANYAAGIVVGEVGTAVASPEQLLRFFL
jgi:rfaE bifunctional protein kinase chain/domain